MLHRIVILGAGYAGAYAAGLLARRLHRDEVEITVVNGEPDFVERMRLHQLAAGHELPRHDLAELFAGTGIRLRVARVDAIDPNERTVTVTGDDGADRLGYDTLLYALGSTAAEHEVPGVAEHAFHVAGRPSALRLRHRLDDLDENGTVLVVGGNLTAIEAATELAETRPGLRVTLATSGELGGWLGSAARDHLRQAFDRFGIAVHEHTTVERVGPSSAVAADGTVFPAGATVWAAGFAVHPVAAASGLAVQENGRIRVDRMMRSVSHPGVYAAGDSAFVIGDNGRPLPMSCASAGFTATQAVAAIIGALTGRPAAQTGLSYVGNHISLGRKDGIFQLVDGAGQSRSWALRGRPAAQVKAAILGAGPWSLRHPTYGLPARRRHVAGAARRSGEAVAA